MIHSHMFEKQGNQVHHDSFTHVTWRSFIHTRRILVHTCDVTNPLIRATWRVTWHIQSCDVTCDVTHSHVWRDVWRDSFWDSFCEWECIVWECIVRMGRCDSCENASHDAILGHMMCIPTLCVLVQIPFSFTRCIRVIARMHSWCALWMRMMIASSESHDVIRVRIHHTMRFLVTWCIPTLCVLIHNALSFTRCIREIDTMHSSCALWMRMMCIYIYIYR